MDDVFMRSQWKTQEETSVTLLCMDSALSEATTSRHADGCPDVSPASPVTWWWRSHNFSMLSHEKLGLSVTKTEHSPSYLMQHTDRPVEHKSTRNCLRVDNWFFSTKSNWRVVKNGLGTTGCPFGNLSLPHTTHGNQFQVNFQPYLKGYTI